MFTLEKNSTGAVVPWEQRPAKAGGYVSGQALEVRNGMLAALEADSAAVPDFICMQTGAVEEDGGPLAVAAVDKDAIYETALADDVPGLAFGQKLAVARGGLSATAGEGAAVVQDFDGEKAGELVRIRWSAGGEAACAAACCALDGGDSAADGASGEASE